MRWDMSVNEKHAGGLDIPRHPFLGQLPAPAGRALLVVAEEADFFTQGLDFGDAVEAEEFAPFSRRLVAELFEARDAPESQIGQKQEDRLHVIIALRSAEVGLGVAQKTKAKQCGKGAKNPGIGHVIGPFKPHFRLIQRAQSGRHAVHAAGCSHPPWELLHRPHCVRLGCLEPVARNPHLPPPG